MWVLVTDWNPLTVWVYGKSYLRFAMLDYDPNNRHRYAHLTNNALVKKYKRDFNTETVGGVPIRNCKDSPSKNVAGKAK